MDNACQRRSCIVSERASSTIAISSSRWRWDCSRLAARQTPCSTARSEHGEAAHDDRDADGSWTPPGCSSSVAIAVTPRTSRSRRAPRVAGRLEAATPRRQRLPVAPAPCAVAERSGERSRVPMRDRRTTAARAARSTARTTCGARRNGGEGPRGHKEWLHFVHPRAGPRPAHQLQLLRRCPARRGSARGGGATDRARAPRSAGMATSTRSPPSEVRVTPRRHRHRVRR